MSDQVVSVKTSAYLFNLGVVKSTVRFLGAEKLFVQHSKIPQIGSFPRLGNQFEKITQVFPADLHPLSQTSHIFPIRAHRYPPIYSCSSPNEEMQIKAADTNKEYAAAYSVVNTCDRKNRGFGATEGKNKDASHPRPFRLPQGIVAKSAGGMTLISEYKASKGSHSMAGPSTHVTVRSSTVPSLKSIYEKLATQFKKIVNVSRNEGGQT